MPNGFKKGQRIAATVEYHEYTGMPDSAAEIIAEVERHRGICFKAAELSFRHDMGTYYHPQHGFVYVPQGSRNAGSPLTALRDNELIVKTDAGYYAVVFPGDYVVRNRSGFYPLSAESFDHGYAPNPSRRGITFPEPSPAL